MPQPGGPPGAPGHIFICQELFLPEAGRDRIVERAGELTALFFAINLNTDHLKTVCHVKRE